MNRILLLSAMLFFTACEEKEPDWTNIYVGMPMDSVRVELGKPTSVSGNIAEISWYYGVAHYGVIDFNTKTKRVTNWTSPQ